MIWIKNKSRDAFSSKRLGECGRKRLESQHDHPENSHDCCRAPGEWNFTNDGSERSSDWRPIAGGWRR
jgi:hypothetical protein